MQSGKLCCGLMSPLINTCDLGFVRSDFFLTELSKNGQANHLHLGSGYTLAYYYLTSETFM